MSTGERIHFPRKRLRRGWKKTKPMVSSVRRGLLFYPASPEVLGVFLRACASLACEASFASVSGDFLLSAEPAGVGALCPPAAAPLYAQTPT